MPKDPPPVGEVTDLLMAMRAGETETFNRILPLVYDELRRVAQHQLGRHRSTPTLDATGLVHEAYMKMADQTRRIESGLVDRPRSSDRAPTRASLP